MQRGTRRVHRKKFKKHFVKLLKNVETCGIVNTERNEREGHKMKIKVNVNQLTRPADISQHIAEVSRGVGYKKAKKGKGSYSRKRRDF